MSRALGLPAPICEGLGYRKAISGRYSQMRNLEAKFRIVDVRQARARAEAIGFALRATLVQHDTFFGVAQGKLKLREGAEGAALINYRRVHEGALEVSDYEIVPVTEPAPLHTMLAGA